MDYFRLSLAAVALSMAAAPAVAGKNEQLTPLAIQAMQSKEFETTPRVLFRSVVSVFQDLGYIIDTADFDSGLITATSATKNKTSFWNALGGVSASGNTRATATVEELANGRSSIRLNFVSSKSSSSWYGQSNKNDKPIMDARVYQIAFEKIDEALFVRQATNPPAPALPPVVASGGNPADAAAAVPASTPMLSNPVEKPTPAPIAPAAPRAAKKKPVITCLTCN